jgi:hypothetical protein
LLVVSAYFEAVRDEPLLAGLELSAKEQARIASTVREDPDRHDMVGGLLPALITANTLVAVAVAALVFPILLWATGLYECIRLA